MTETGIDTLAIALVDRYLVGEELGRGASATVYRVRDSGFLRGSLPANYGATRSGRRSDLIRGFGS